MAPVTESPALTRELAEALRRRQAELHALLAAGDAVPDQPPEVQDFKDVAAQDLRAAIDEVTYAHASQELAQVVGALRRVADGSYGLCEDCDEPIDERRLRALPATRYCTACQALHERTGAARR